MVRIDCRNSKLCGHLHEDGPVLEDARLAARTDHERAFVLFEDGWSSHHRTRSQGIAVIDRSLDETASFVKIHLPMALERGHARIAGAKLKWPFGPRHRGGERKPQRDELDRSAGRRPSERALEVEQRGADIRERRDHRGRLEARLDEVRRLLEAVDAITKEETMNKLDAKTEISGWLHLMPRLPVSDMDRSIAHYQEALSVGGPGGIWVFSPDGKHLGTIKPPETPANCNWGDDGKSLYITARTGLYRIKLAATGQRTLYQ